MSASVVICTNQEGLVLYLTLLTLLPLRFPKVNIENKSNHETNQKAKCTLGKYLLKDLSHQCCLCLSSAFLMHNLLSFVFCMSTYVSVRAQHHHRITWLMDHNVVLELQDPTE